MTTLTRSTCPYCGVGCGVVIEARDGQIVGVSGDPEHPANFGRLCSKGSTLALTAAQTITRMTRLTQPMLRASRDAVPLAIDWPSAMDTMVERFGAIIERDGPDALGFYLSGQLLTEDYYVFNKLAKGLVGTNNLDTNSRLCMSSAVAGYKQTLGVDAPPTCYEDVDHADLIVITGSNAAIAHPILFRRIEDARRANPSLRLITIDPRRTETAEVSDLHLPIKPGSDIALYHGILHLLIWNDWIDRRFIAEHTNGFEALRQRVIGFPPHEVALRCGISVNALKQAAQWFGQSRAVLSLYCQGLNQSVHGTANNIALINLHLATGQIGRPGAGPFSLTGQPNAMGGREVGGMANLLSGHRDLGNPTDRDEIARLWGVPSVPSRPGKTAVEMFEAAADGQIKALWIACTNPAQSMPNQATVRRALQRAEFVVVQEAFAQTETTAYADLLLPAATWGEKEGTVTNSERRISRVRAAVPAPGRAQADWQIAVGFGRRLEKRWGRERSLFADASTPESVWNEHRETTRGRDLDISGLSYALLEQAPRQWPFASGAVEGRKRLYEDHCFPTPDGRARFVDVGDSPPADRVDARFAFALTTGRLRDQWHGMSRTGTLGRSFGHVPAPAIHVNPQDLARRGWQAGDWVRVSSRRGEMALPVAADEAIGPMQAWVPMHWGAQYLSGRQADGQRMAGVNALTTSAYCPDSRQPALKQTAVRIEPASFDWGLVAAAWLPRDRAYAALSELRELMDAFDATICVPFGRELSADEQLGVLFKAAANQAASPALLARIETVLGLDSKPLLRYVDPGSAQHRVMMLAPRGAPGGCASAASLAQAHSSPDSIRTKCGADASGSASTCGAAQASEAVSAGDEQCLRAFVLAGDVSAERWLLALLQDELPAQAFGRRLLAAGAEPAGKLAPRGRQVCSCLNVLAPQIEVALDAQPPLTGGPAEQAAQRLTMLQSSLRCGTSCGSCVPELRRMIAARASRAQPAPVTASTPGAVSAALTPDDLLIGESR